MYRVAVVDDEPITRMDVAGMLADFGYEVCGEAGDGFDAVEICRVQKPDVVLMDVRMPVFDGLTAAETILSEELAGCVVLLTAFDDMQLIDRAKEIGVTGYLVKPIEQKLLRPTIEIAMAQSDRLKKSNHEAQKVRQKLSELHLVRKAQSTFALREHISEDEAYRRMRRMAMDKRVSIAEIAQAMVEMGQKK